MITSITPLIDTGIPTTSILIIRCKDCGLETVLMYQFNDIPNYFNKINTHFDDLCGACELDREYELSNQLSKQLAQAA